MEEFKEVDESAIDYNLSLSAEQRLEQHQAALEVVLELELARDSLYEAT